MLMPGARDTNSICSLQGVFREKRAQHASQRLQNASKGELEDVCGYTSGSTSDEEVSEGAQERRDSEVSENYVLEDISGLEHEQVSLEELNLEEEHEGRNKKRKTLQTACVELASVDFSSFCSNVTDFPKDIIASEVEKTVKSCEEIQPLLLMSNEAFLEEILSM